MSFASGTRIGPYEVVTAIGAGGMGEVLRARDTKLGREVAIKVLPAAFAQDAERVARFRREAQILASLNHPNIAAIYGLEEAEGVLALAMELVEGEDLAQRLKRGAIPVDEALLIAKQIAEALEEAHEKGIVHRDLKPANVKVTEDGKVKVLDFGLAKAFSADPMAQSGAHDLSQSPTLATAAGTQAGVILGTAAYMSPEQARGKAVDRRADVWAFGVVLFEMLSGQRLFRGDTASDTMAAVLREPVPWSALPAETPIGVRLLLERCLDRDLRRRLQAAAEARIALEAPGAPAPGPAAARPASRVPAWLPWLVALAAGAALIAVWSRSSGGGASGTPAFSHFTRLTFEAGRETSPALSPDGEFVAYAARMDGDRDILLLRVGGQRPNNLTGDSPADEDHPAFSPDGRSIAFHSTRDGGGVFVMGATGESVRRLTTFGDNPAWSSDGKEIVFATEGESDPHAREKESELWVVPAAGGEPRRIFVGDAVQPTWSPGGQRIAFWRATGGGVRRVATIARDGSDLQVLSDGTSLDWNPVWTRSHLYFMSDRSGVMGPWRVAMDEQSGRARGEPEPIVLPTGWAGQLALSQDERRLAYRTSELTAELRRFPFDARAGRITGASERVLETAIPVVGFDLSKDGWIVFRTMAMQEDVYVIRADGSGLRRLTDDAAKDRNPVWSPDGQQVAFYSNRGGSYEVWTVGRDGGALRRRTQVDGDGLEGQVLYPLWSPDGTQMVGSWKQTLVRFSLGEAPAEASALDVLPTERGPSRSIFPQSWSPDGRSIACVGVGDNGQLLDGIHVFDVEKKATRFLAIPFSAPSGSGTYPTLAWLPDSRRGVLRWAEQILLIDTDSGAITPLLKGLDRAEAIVRLSGDQKWLYMLESRDQGDLWLASR
jgi:Tol biopolymer transport system component